MKKTRFMLFGIFLGMLTMASCSENEQQIRTLDLACMYEQLTEIEAILDTAKVGTADYTFPQQSIDDLQAAKLRVRDGISQALADQFVLQYEVGNVCNTALQAINEFKGSYNYTLPTGAEGELLVNGLNRKGSIDFGDHEEYTKYNTFTVELWTKYAKDFLDFEMCTLIGTTSENTSNNNDKFEGWNIHFQRSGNLRASMGCGSGVLEQTKAYPTNYGQWNHIALVWDINAAVASGDDRPYHMKMYVNGELFWQKNDDIVANGSPRPMLPGTKSKKMRAFIDPYHPDRCLTGYLKKFRMWTEAKTVDQIKELMTVDVTGTEKNLLCAWDFTVVPADPTNMVDKTGKFSAKIEGSYKWNPVQ